MREYCDQWKYGYKSLRGKILWKFTLVAVLWCIWIERNTRTFKGSKNHYKSVDDSILFKVALWAMRCKEFHGYDVDSIIWDWDVVL